MAAVPFIRFAGRLAKPLLRATPTAVTVGAIGLGAANIGPVKKTLGQTEEQQLEKRLDNNQFNRRTGELEQTPLQWLGDVAFNRNITPAQALTEDTERIQNTTDDKYDVEKIRSRLNSYKLDTEGLDLGETQTQTNYHRVLEDKKELLRIADQLAAADIDVSSLDDKTIGGLNRAYANREGGALDTKRSNEKRQQKLDVKDARRYADRQDLLLAQMQANNQQTANNFQLQMAQQQYQNRSLDMRDARDARKDKMLIIAQIMKGLEASSKAFTY